jgi:hypothetical protein
VLPPSAPELLSLEFPPSLLVPDELLCEPLQPPASAAMRMVPHQRTGRGYTNALVVRPGRRVEAEA